MLHLERLDRRLIIVLDDKDFRHRFLPVASQNEFRLDVYRAARKIGVHNHATAGVRMLREWFR